MPKASAHRARQTLSQAHVYMRSVYALMRLEFPELAVAVDEGWTVVRVFPGTISTGDVSMVATLAAVVADAGPSGHPSIIRKTTAQLHSSQNLYTLTDMTELS
jgi:hypothetical protein